MAKKSEQAAPLPIVDNLLSPELFADAAVAFFLRNGVVTIALTSTRADHGTSSGSTRHQVVGRVTMPIVGAQGLVRGLYNLLKQQGFDPSPSQGPKSVQ
jgi:hypothetical protein